MRAWTSPFRVSRQIHVIPGIAGQLVQAVAAAQSAEFTGVLVWQRERAAAQCLRRHVQQQRLGGETIADERADVVPGRIGVDRVAVCPGSGQRHPLQVAGYVLAGFRAVSGDHLVRAGLAWGRPFGSAGGWGV